MGLFSEGMLLGLSLGVTCIATCAPVYAPILMQTGRGALGALWAVLLMSLGRFLSYAAVGIMAGAAGALAAGAFPMETVTAVSYLLIAAFLIYTALVRGRAEKHGGCPAGLVAKTAGNPFLAGIVTGFSVCPPFIGALTRGFDAGGAFGGMLLFTGFFVGTTVYFLPLAFLPLVARHRFVRVLGIFFSLVAALWFVLLGLDRFFDLRFKAEMYLEDAYIVDYAQADLVVLDGGADGTTGAFLAGGLPHARHRAVADADLSRALRELPPHSNVLLLVTSAPGEEIRSLAVEGRLNVIWTFAPHDEEAAGEIQGFLSSYVLKARRERGFLFRLPLSGHEVSTE